MESSVVFVFLIAIIVGVGLEMLFQWELLILFALGIFLSLHQEKQAQQRKVQETHYLLESYLSLSPCYLQPLLKLGLLLQVFTRSFTILVGSGHPIINAQNERTG